VGGDRLERHGAALHGRADPLLEPTQEPGQRPGRRRARGEQLGGQGLQPDDLVHRPVGGPLQLRHLDDLVAAGPGVDQQGRGAGVVEQQPQVAVRVGPGELVAPGRHLPLQLLAGQGVRGAQA
jgi:hypothetical protein